MKLFIVWLRKFAFILCLIPSTVWGTSSVSESIFEPFSLSNPSQAVPNIDFNDPELVYNNVYAVHMTKILLKDNTAIAGALINGRIPPQGQFINSRATLHHCLGGPGPIFILGKVYFNKGQVIEVPLRSDHKFTYAYLDRLRNFKGEIAGGSLDDFFTMISHSYSKESIIIIPEIDKKQFYLLNPTYEGEVILYPHNHDLSDVIKQVLRDKKSWCFDFYADDEISEEKKQKGYKYEKKCNFYPGDRANLREEADLFFEKQNFYSGPPYPSPFERIENYSHYFNQILFAKYNKVTQVEIWEACLPTGYIPILKALILRNMEKIFALPFNEKVKSALIRWKQDFLSFIALHEFDSQLRQEQQKSIFLSSHLHWPEILAARSHSEQLKLLVQGFSSVHPSELAIIESQGFRWQNCKEKQTSLDQIYISSYLEKDRLFFVNEPHPIYDFNESDTQLIKSYWLLQTYFTSSLSLTPSEIFEKGAHDLSSALKNYPTFFTYHLYHSFILYPEKTLTLFNESTLSPLLKETFNISYTGELTVEILVRVFPQFKILYEKCDDLVLNYIQNLFKKVNDLSKVSPRVLDGCASVINLFARMFYSQPIDYPQTPPSIYRIEKAYKRYPPIYACEQNTDYDLSNLFENLCHHLGIHEIYKKEFPSQAHFLKYRKQNGTVPTFGQVYKKLKKLKE